MARLIDATRIEQFILNNCSDNEEINTIYGELINAPTIDLVRCGECKWWNSGFCNNGRADANLKLEGNCFCDEGERRADDRPTEHIRNDQT